MRELLHFLIVGGAIALVHLSLSAQTQTTTVPSVTKEVICEIRTAPGSEKEKSWMDPAVVVAAGAVALTLLSLSFNRYQFQKNRADTLDWKERDSRANRQSKLLDSLRWFEGGIQNRSVGIAVVEGHWTEQPELRPTWASVLVGQAVYIITKPEAELPEHERRNLERILAVLRKARTQILPNVLDATLLDPVQEALAKLPTRKTKPEKDKELAPEQRPQFMQQVYDAVLPYSDLLKIPKLPGVTSEA